jgi:hypothetical protein
VSLSETLGQVAHDSCLIAFDLSCFGAGEPKAPQSENNPEEKEVHRNVSRVW